jgi:hypothetical protein
MYQNGKMLRMEEGGIKKKDGGINLIKIYCKNCCKCYNVPPVEQLYDNTKRKNKNAKIWNVYGAH